MCDASFERNDKQARWVGPTSGMHGKGIMRDGKEDCRSILFLRERLSEQ